ncbi:hypothetical protein EET67_01185 [Pseudaminobacter arsenicus]|uniref:Transglycosylase SLT domain-containing protein n=1 Tax=Borborobacter arsenicus TaxID=1851146 RepID=A0A432VCQ8_9HYPH|nr:transglycosylase SLT domain-containing protein [Pseudaminobacter arsenicus]RUM99904.1 hypothetical protein EET67_01185 [Pseudaminobacter arsenicus]
MTRTLFFVALLMLGSCATAPNRINNACAVFDQRDGWFTNWHREAKQAEREFGVPVPILMATIYTESGFNPRAKPPRTKLLGFIPWKRPSTAYGYSQALDGTWTTYQTHTGRWGARRSNFADAIHFIGWYHNRSHQLNGIALNDAYSLYLAYYSGHAGYSKGVWRNSSVAQRGARRAADMATRYAEQLRACGR